MPRQCTVCIHARRDEIDEALVRGQTFREVSGRFETSVAALFRHKRSHVPRTLVMAKQAAESARGEDLLEEIRGLRQRTMRIMDRAEQKGDLRTALRAVSEATKLADLMSKVQGQTGEEDWQRADNLQAALQHVILLPKKIPPEIMAQRTKEAEEILAARGRAMPSLPPVNDLDVRPDLCRHLEPCLDVESEDQADEP